MPRSRRADRGRIRDPRYPPDHRGHLPPEALPPEALRVSADLALSKTQPLEALDRTRQRRRALLIEQHTRATVAYRLAGAAHRVGDHRDARRLRLDGDDPEVLLAREQQRARATQQLVALALADAPEERDPIRRSQP